MIRLVAIAAIALAAVSAPAPVHAYLKLGAYLNGTVVDVTWRQPVPYFVSERNASNVSTADLQGAVARAAATWSAVESARGAVRVPGHDHRAARGDRRPHHDRVSRSARPRSGARRHQLHDRHDDGRDHRGRRVPEFAVPVVGRSIGRGRGVSTSSRSRFTSSATCWASVTPPLARPMRTGGGNRRVTASGAIMFPIAMSSGTIAERVLHADDIAGISDLYPTAAASRDTGAIVGRITKNGQGVLGAHVLAFNPETRRVDRQLHAEHRRGVRDRAAAGRAVRARGSSPLTMPIPRASFRRRSTSTSP